MDQLCPRDLDSGKRQSSPDWEAQNPAQSFQVLISWPTAADFPSVDCSWAYADVLGYFLVWTGQRDPTAGRLTMVGRSSPRLLTATCP
jgi:hypothetical protein